MGLARAILSPAKILILDETLSGLDEQSALVVLGNLRREIAGTRCLLYLLYGYKSTRTDAEGAGRTIIALTSSPLSLRGAFDKVLVLCSLLEPW